MRAAAKKSQPIDLDYQNPQLYMSLMTMQFRSLLLGLVLIGFALTNSKAARLADLPDQCRALNRSSFPHGFLFGTATSAYQYEGAANLDGRGPSIWDTYSHKHPERIADGSNGDVAVDQYHRYKEDVGILKDIGFDAYRLSISWSRLLPHGTLSGGVNRLGIRYYNNLINELLRKGIRPVVTLFHWDLPQALEDRYGGFLSPRVVDHFRDYADLCFKEFGDRVKQWTTVNEPHTFSNHGYADGEFAPGRCSAWQKRNCTGGDSGTEPYLVAHHLLLSHAAAVNLYRKKYQAIQKGAIGIVIHSHWFEPATDTEQDKKAALRAVDFMFGWYMDPLTRGQYPDSMRYLVGPRLPVFTKEQSTLLVGSFDFIGFNYYTARYASNAPKNDYPSYLTDARVHLSPEIGEIAIGPQPGIEWLYLYPKGLYKILLYVKEKYNDPVIYITENGVSEVDNPNLTLEQSLNDPIRITSYHHHLCYIREAIINGSVNIKGYFAWSLLDNYEWSSGFSVRFGLNYVDYKNGLKRHPKLSAHWLKSFLT